MDLSIAITAGLLAALVLQPAAAADAYAVSAMDLAPTAARLSGQRHTGPFASGASLSFGAALAPLDPSTPRTR